jgi:hypothetical protein
MLWVAAVLLLCLPAQLKDGGEGIIIQGDFPLACVSLGASVSAPV